MHSCGASGNPVRSLGTQVVHIIGKNFSKYTCHHWIVAVFVLKLDNILCMCLWEPPNPVCSCVFYGQIWGIKMLLYFPSLQSGNQFCHCVYGMIVFSCK